MTKGLQFYERSHPCRCTSRREPEHETPPCRTHAAAVCWSCACVAEMNERGL